MLITIIPAGIAIAHPNRFVTTGVTTGQVADKECRARPCARERGVKNCAYCEAFPCEKLKPLIPPIFFAAEAEYNLCMRQFDCRPNLTKILLEKGKPPFWVDRQSKS